MANAMASAAENAKTRIASANRAWMKKEFAPAGAEKRKMSASARR